MTTCFVIFGIISFIAVADDLGLWIFLDRLYNGKVHVGGMWNGEGKQPKVKNSVFTEDYVRENRR